MSVFSGVALCDQCWVLVQRGLAPRVFEYLFQKIQAEEDTQVRHTSMSSVHGSSSTASRVTSCNYPCKAALKHQQI